MADGEKATRLSEKTVLSLQLVIVLLGLSVWLNRLAAKVEQHDEVLSEVKENRKDAAVIHANLDRRIYELELTCKPRKSRKGE